VYLIWILSNKLDLNQETHYTLQWYSMYSIFVWFKSSILGLQVLVRMLNTSFSFLITYGPNKLEHLFLASTSSLV